MQLSRLDKGLKSQKKTSLVRSLDNGNVITLKGEILDQKSIKVLLLELEVKVENNESEMRKLETTAK